MWLVQAQRIFSETEEQQLLQMLGFSEVDLHTVLDACAYIFEQAAYRNANGAVLGAQLHSVGLDETLVRQISCCRFANTG